MNTKKFTMMAMAVAFVLAACGGQAAQPTAAPAATTAPSTDGNTTAATGECGDKTKLAKELSWVHMGQLRVR